MKPVLQFAAQPMDVTSARIWQLKETAWALLNKLPVPKKVTSWFLIWQDRTLCTVLRALHHAQLPLTGWEIPLLCFRVQPAEWQHFTAGLLGRDEVSDRETEHFHPGLWLWTTPPSARPAEGHNCTDPQQPQSQLGNRSTHRAGLWPCMLPQHGAVLHIAAQFTSCHTEMNEGDDVNVGNGSFSSPALLCHSLHPTQPCCGTDDLCEAEHSQSTSENRAWLLLDSPTTATGGCTGEWGWNLENCACLRTFITIKDSYYSIWEWITYKDIRISLLIFGKK